MTVSRDHYFKLGSEVPQERLQSAIALVKDLSAENDRDEWDYALNRLIKGLNTTRQSARYGFSMALTEVAQELIKSKDHPLTVAGFMDSIEKSIELKASMKGKDERAAVFGRLFGYQTLINSKIIFDGEHATATDVSMFTDGMLDLATQKSWLRETIIFTLCSFIQQYDMTDALCLQILQKTNDLGLNTSSEGLAIYLSLPASFRAANGPKIQNLKTTWKNFDPLSKGNLPLLAKSLKDVSTGESDEDQKAKQKGSWSPRVHFVWDVVLSAIVNVSDASNQETPSKKRKISKSKATKVDESSVMLKEFWKVVVDETLFSDKSSHERKYWGFEVFIKALHVSSFHQVGDLFTPNLVRCLINQSAQNNRMLNKISVKCLQTIKQECIDQPLKAPVVLECLIDPKCGSGWNFDLVTKSKTTESLIGCLAQKQDHTNEKSLVVLDQLKDVLVRQFNNSLSTSVLENEFKGSGDNVQKWCLNSFLQLIRGNKVYLNNKNVAWVEDILKLIVKHAFFKIPDSPQVSSNIRTICKDRLNSILGDIIKTKRKTSSWSLYCVKYIKKLEKSYGLVQEFDGELLDVKKECAQILDSVEEMKDSSVSDTVYGFELLFSMVLLQIYMGDEDAFTVVNELKVCFEAVLGRDNEEDVDASVVLTEIILSFISKKSTLLRKFCYIIWESLLCEKEDNGNVRANEECLELLFNILTAKENKEGQSSLFDDEDGMVVDDGENDEEKAEEEEEEEEEKEEEKEEDEEDDSSSSDNDDDSSDDNEDEDDKEAQLDKETNIKLAQALGIPTSTSGEVKFDDISSGDDDSSYESESADDEEMLAMDDHLSKIFKERRDNLESSETGNKRKNEVLEAREQMIFFKHRVLDLLEIFTKEQPESVLNFSIIKPVIVVINLTLDKNVGVKAHKYLKTKLAKVKINTEKLTSEQKTALSQQLLDLSEWIHQQAVDVKSSNNSHALACNSASILVAKTLVSIDKDNIDAVLDLYTTSMKKWAKSGKGKAQPSFFFDFINWLSSRNQNN